MQKLFVLLLGVGFSAAAMAQVPQTEHQKKKAEMNDLRTDSKARAAAKHQENKDLGKLRVKKAVQDSKTVHAYNRDEHADARQLRDQGVHHPITKAKRANKVHDDNHKDHTN